MCYKVSEGHQLISGEQQPTGLRVLISESYGGHCPSLHSLGHVEIAMKQLGTLLGEHVGMCMTSAVCTVGHQGLHKCYPKKGFGWMWHDHQGAMQYYPVALEELIKVKFVRVVDCMTLSTPKPLRPHGHLGTNPVNLALFLDTHCNRVWRIEKYVELWLRLQCEIMRQSHNTAYACRQGCHRSLGWAHLESSIAMELGIDVTYHSVSSWVQSWSACQYKDTTSFNGCPECGSVQQKFRNISHESLDLATAATDEFWEVICAAESLVDRHSLYDPDF